MKNECLISLSQFASFVPGSWKELKHVKMKDTFINGDTSNDELQNCLVLDLGTANTKSGWSNKSIPDFTIPSIVGKSITVIVLLFTSEIYMVI